jgi:hypothetical protein
VTRPLLALGLAIVFVAAVLGIVLAAVPRHPPALDLTGAEAPLTTRLLLVVADRRATRFVQIEDSSAEARFDFAACSAATVLFALIFLLRIGVQSSLDFGGMDWRAAAFDDAETPVWTITAGIAWKHISVMILLAATVVAPLGRAMRDRIAAVLLGAFALRPPCC